jgi:hypothetical protein
MADAVRTAGGHGYIAGLFADEGSFVAACRAARAAGHTDLQAWTPWPVHGLEEVLGLERSWIGRAVFPAILIGFVLCSGFLYQLTVEDWPVVYGGKPYGAWQLWVVPVLETGLLLGAVVNLLAVFHTCRLVPDPFATLPDPRLSDDRFALALPAGGDAAAVCAWFAAQGAESTLAVDGETALARPRFADLPGQEAPHA